MAKKHIEDVSELADEVEEYCLDLKEYPFALTKDGAREEYVIREMTGRERDAYLTALNAMMGGQAGSASGKVDMQKIRSFDGIEAELLSRVIFKEGKPVPKATVQSWKASVQHKLFLKAQKLTGLGDEEDVKKDEEEAKND